MVVLVQSRNPVFLHPGTAGKGLFCPLNGDLPHQPLKNAVLSARLLNHPDGAPQIDKAAGDLQTPFNKALFSGGLIPPSPSLPRLTPVSLSLPPYSHLSLSHALSHPSPPPCRVFPSPSHPSLFLGSNEDLSLVRCSVTWEKTQAGIPLSLQCSSFSSRFWGRISEDVVVKGHSDLLWTKVERKRTFDRLKQWRQNEMKMITIRDKFHLKRGPPCRSEVPPKQV